MGGGSRLPAMPESRREMPALREASDVRGAGARDPSRRAVARRQAAQRACVAISSGRVLEREPELVRECGQPGQHVAQLVKLLRGAALPRGAGELADLL